jgi:hypothetical protein
MTMTLDIETIERNLEKARTELSFWENVKTIFKDPRIAGLNGVIPTASLAPTPEAPQIRAYGGLKRLVYTLLPKYGDTGMTTNDLVQAMKTGGYVFTSKHPGMAVNEALLALSKEGQAHTAGKNGLAKIWTKGKEKEAPVGTS